MKKALLSPICSALVIPGMGQVINGQLKKGVILLAAVFLLVVIFCIKMYLIISNMLVSGTVTTGDPFAILNAIMTEKNVGLYVLCLVFCALWLYSVIDAFLVGIRQDRLERKKPS